jgi:GNAT superfamily N-acetyltransferase
VVILSASAADLSLVIDILDDAARWLISKGIRQWESPPPPEAWELFEREIAQGRVYIVRLADAPEAVATFRVEWTGAPLWQEEKNAGYLYTLALRPKYVGHGLGKSIVRWVENYFYAEGRRWFRLDCIASNERLRRWYEEFGFRYCATRVSGTYVLALYELELGSS